MALLDLSAHIDLALLALRISLGLIMIIHGTALLTGQTRQLIKPWMLQIGIPGPLYELVSVLQLVGGIVLILGVLTRLAALYFCLLMVGTIYLYYKVLGRTTPPPETLYQVISTVKRASRGAMVIIGGWEFDLLILATALLLLTTGAGSISLEAIVGIYL